MKKQSAGLLMYRFHGDTLQVLLAHPGGPLWAERGPAVWTIPKGHPDPGEDLLNAAKREFQEETGIAPGSCLYELKEIEQQDGKRVKAWAFEGDCNPSDLISNNFVLEWPKGSGNFLEYPEVDQIEWLPIPEAKERLLPGQERLLDELAEYFAVKHKPRSPAVLEILKILNTANVEYVLTGSVAALLQGAEVVPGDLDIVPRRTRSNLEKVINALGKLEAQPAGPFGHWEKQEDGRDKWIARPTSPAEILAWRPNPDDFQSLDHLFVTRLGNLDIVPELTGGFESHRERAVWVEAEGYGVWVEPLALIQERMEALQRKKDSGRLDR